MASDKKTATMATRASQDEDAPPYSIASASIPQPSSDPDRTQTVIDVGPVHSAAAGLGGQRLGYGQGGVLTTLFRPFRFTGEQTVLLPAEGDDSLVFCSVCGHYSRKPGTGFCIRCHRIAADGRARTRFLGAFVLAVGIWVLAGLMLGVGAQQEGWMGDGNGNGNRGGKSHRHHQ